MGVGPMVEPPQDMVVQQTLPQRSFVKILKVKERLEESSIRPENTDLRKDKSDGDGDGVMEME